MHLGSCGNSPVRPESVPELIPDDTILPGEILHAPLFAVLDAFKSLDPEHRERAWKWMQCSMRSYFR